MFILFRYWLLTVLRAGESIPPKIELKLARLYKTAFLRQQQRHLGLLQTNTRLRRSTRGHALVKTKVYMNLTYLNLHVFKIKNNFIKLIMNK